MSMGKCAVQDCEAMAAMPWSFIDVTEKAAVGSAVRNNMAVCSPHHEAFADGAAYTHLGGGQLLLLDR